MSTLLKSLEIYDLLKKQSKPFVLRKLNSYFGEAYKLGYLYLETKFTVQEFNELLKNGKRLNIKINKNKLFPIIA